MDKEVGKDLYAEYPMFKKEIHRLLQCVLDYENTGMVDDWGNLEEAIADLIERVRK